MVCKKQNATHSFRSEKILHHFVQRLSKPRQNNLLIIFKSGFFHFLGIFPKKWIFKTFFKQSLFAAFSIYYESAQKTLPKISTILLNRF
jgi:hypothetical protein